MKFKIEVNILKLQIHTIVQLKSIFSVLIVSMVFLACSQRDNNRAGNSLDDNSQPMHAGHDSVSVVANDNGMLPVVNRPHFHTVEIRLMKFNPGELTVAKGDTVVWVNNGITAHDVTAQPEARWTSSSMPVGTSWQMIAKESSDYYCSIHVVMKGKLVVK